MKLKKSAALILIFMISALSLLPPVTSDFAINARAALLMEPGSGKILFNQNGHQRLPPASVTKVMTMLLIMEAIHSDRAGWNDSITTSAVAAGMGGSQVFLKEGETLPLREMFKAIAVVSANDASAAVAEYLYGSVGDFIDAMNQKAKALGLKDTHFTNETGLPDPAHYSSAYDLAVISRELLKYPEVLKFTSIWLDSLRQGKFILRNTNELIKVYPGADGLKTGHTDEAKFCLSATAKHGDFRLLSVILGADSDAQRVSESRRLLDYGFRNFQWKLITKANSPVGKIYIKDGSPDQVPVKTGQNFGVVIPRGSNQVIRTELVPGQNIRLPVKPGQSIGVLRGILKGETIGETSVYSTAKVKRANFLVRAWRSFWDFIKGLFGKGR